MQYYLDTELSRDPDFDSVPGSGRPSWSPDGARIAATSADGVFVMNADGTGLRRLTHNTVVDTWPARSPDGKKIAFHSLRDGNREIDVLSLE